MTYLVVKVLHVSAVVVWIAAMLIVPLMLWQLRNSSLSEEDRGQIRSLFQYISTPGIVAVWVLGLWIMSLGGFMQAGWMAGKLVIVVVLSALHGMLSGQLRRYAEQGDCLVSRQGHRLFALELGLVIAVIALVVLKPI